MKLLRVIVGVLLIALIMALAAVAVGQPAVSYGNRFAGDVAFYLA